MANNSLKNSHALEHLSSKLKLSRQSTFWLGRSGVWQDVVWGDFVGLLGIAYDLKLH